MKSFLEGSSKPLHVLRMSSLGTSASVMNAFMRINRIKRNKFSTYYDVATMEWLKEKEEVWK